MSLTIEEICCLKFKAQACVSQIGNEICLKENAGYCVDGLYEKLKMAISLKGMIEEKISASGKTIKSNIIHFCNKKVFASKNNSLFLDGIDSQDDCEDETQLTDECCISICDIESKLNQICSNC